MPSSIFNSLEGGQLGGPGSDFVIVEWSDSGTCLRVRSGSGSETSYAR
jgi:hypothetical protein